MADIEYLALAVFSIVAIIASYRGTGQDRDLVHLGDEPSAASGRKSRSSR